MLRQKYFLVMSLCIFWKIGNSTADTLKMEERLSLQFIVKTLETLHKVSPSQEEAFANYDKVLKSLLMDARALQREHHLAEQKGLRGQEEKLKAEKQGEVLLDQALEKTEQYLQQLVDGLKKHRQDIKKSLMPKSEGKP